MFIIETQPFYETKRQHFVWFAANMLKASEVLSSLKSNDSAEHFKKTKGNYEGSFQWMSPLTSSQNFLCPSGSELVSCFLLFYTTKEGQQLEGKKKDVINLQLFFLLLA